MYAMMNDRNEVLLRPPGKGGSYALHIWGFWDQKPLVCFEGEKIMKKTILILVIALVLTLLITMTVSASKQQLGTGSDYFAPGEYVTLMEIETIIEASKCCPNRGSVGLMNAPEEMPF